VCRAPSAGGDDLIRYGRNQPPFPSRIRGTLAESSYRVDDVLDLRGRLSHSMGASEVGVAGNQSEVIADGVTMQNLLADEVACASVGLPWQLRHRC
jgi:hypothetical protein